MKKHLLFVSGLMLTTTACAEILPYTEVVNYVDNKGFYVSAYADFTKTKVTFDSVNATLEDLKTSGFTPALAVGYDFGGFRAEVNYKDLGKLTSDDPAIKGEMKIKNLGFSGIYNFRASTSFQPFIGGRLVYTKFNTDNELKQSLENQGIEVKSNNLGVGVVTGMEYQLIENLLVGMDAHWDLLSHDPAHSFGAGLTLRFRF